MARIANRAVIESADLPLEGVAKGPDAARSVECLVGNTIDRKFLPLLQRRHLAAHAIHDRFASLAVFVDDAIRAPGQVVIDGVGGILRKRPDPQSDSVEHVETLRHVEGHDGHEARSEPALRDEGCVSIGGELPHTACAHDILRQVEIMGTGRSGRFRDVLRQTEGGGIEHMADHRLDSPDRQRMVTLTSYPSGPV